MHNFYQNLKIIPIFLIVGLSLSYFHLERLHDKYWGSESKVPQGTIFAVQTVEHNIAAASFPYTIANLLKNKRYQDITPYMYTAYTLTGFAVTTCASGSTKLMCIDEEIIEFTKNKRWINSSNIENLIKDADFNILTSNHMAGIDWQYNKPKDHSIINQKFEPLGDVIGRIYYVRSPRPSLNEQIISWVSDFFISQSTDKKYYGSIVISYLLASFLMWLFSIFITKLRRDKKFIKIQNQELEDKKVLLENEKKKLNDEYINTQNNLKEAIEKTNILKSESLELHKKTKEINADSAEYLKYWNDAQESLKQEESKVQIQKNKLAILEKEKATVKIKSSNLKAQKSIGKKSVDQQCFAHFIDGLNTYSLHNVLYHEKVIKNDIENAIKEGISLSGVVSTLSDILKTYNRKEAEGSMQIIEKIKTIPDLYHNKGRSKIRVYFLSNSGRITIVGIWSINNAPHYSDSKNWNVLHSRCSSYKD